MKDFHFDFYLFKSRPRGCWKSQEGIKFKCVNILRNLSQNQQYQDFVTIIMQTFSGNATSISSKSWTGGRVGPQYEIKVLQ